MDEKEIIEYLDEERELSQKRKDKYKRVHYPFYGIEDEEDLNQEFGEREEHQRYLMILFNYFLEVFDDSKKDTVEEAMTDIKNRIEEYGGIDYNKSYSSYRKILDRVDFNDKEEDAVLNYVYKLRLTEEQEERKKLERQLEGLMPVGTSPSVVAEHCI
jgi:hypothetical protein